MNKAQVMEHHQHLSESTGSYAKEGLSCHQLHEQGSKELLIWRDVGETGRITVLTAVTPFIPENWNDFSLCSQKYCLKMMIFPQMLFVHHHSTAAQVWKILQYLFQ